jgi:hypothetical protein
LLGKRAVVFLQAYIEKEMLASLKLFENINFEWIRVELGAQY